MVAQAFDVVIGVDTHRDSHALALVRRRDGVVVNEEAVPANRAGHRQALRIAKRQRGARRLWALEGTGSYGAGLARFLAERGERVVEVERPKRSGRTGRCKSDPLDALRAARAALAGEASACPRAAGKREALRVLLIAREGAVHTRQVGLNQLRALLLTAPDPVRERLSGLGRRTLVRSCSSLRPRPGQEPALYGTLLALKTCARRVEAAMREADQLERELRLLVDELAPPLLALHGVGPISAAQVLVAWSHPGRFKSEAAFARLAGAAPIPASSGTVVRYRLDRGGDRKLNRALHAIVLCRRRRHAATIAYVERRLTEGKSKREAVRCLKRYLARSIFRLLEAMPIAA